VTSKTRPKRHHWWPEAQSKYWAQGDGLICVTTHDGRVFRTTPGNIGVESGLYTRFEDDEVKDDSIESWFANTIDNTIASILDHILDPSNIRRQPYKGDPKKAETLKKLGYVVNPYIEEVRTPVRIRAEIAIYAAALLVRNPIYLKKLVTFHELEKLRRIAPHNAALDNMLWLHGLYADKISTSMYIFARRISSSEFLHSDGGLHVEEPWRSEKSIPFDIHIPLTPDLALTVLPLPGNTDLDYASMVSCNNQLVARMNRISLATARRFVFSRQSPPLEFIRKNFGRPAPLEIGFRFINGKLETTYDPKRWRN
jgi:hypothetical protein